MTKLELLKILKKVSNKAQIKIYADCDLQGDTEFECAGINGYMISEHSEEDEQLILTAY